MSAVSRFTNSAGRYCAVASRDGLECRIQAEVQIEPATDAAKLDDLSTAENAAISCERCNGLRLIRQYRQPAIRAALPPLGRIRDWTRRQATQIVQCERQQPVG